MAERDTFVDDGFRHTPATRVAAARGASSVPEAMGPERQSASGSAAFWPHRRPLLPRPIQFAACLLFLLILAAVCYRRPIPDYLDRYIYEAIILGRSQPIQLVYEHVKHENPRAESSTILDSPQHLRELEPLYAIRPLYLKLVSLMSTLLPIQDAINLVSALSLFGIGVVVLFWTARPLQTALLMAAYPVLSLGRMGTPDALAALLAISALWLTEKHRKHLIAIVLLFISLAVRTDNVLLVLVLLAWLAWNKRISLYSAAAASLLACAIVLAIDRWAGNYGWTVLFRFSFIGGRYPALIPHTVSLREYMRAFVAGATSVFPQMALWLLIGLWSCMRRPNPVLLLTACVAALHFVLFPSPEARYLMWACVVCGASLICSMEGFAPAQ